MVNSAKVLLDSVYETVDGHAHRLTTIMATFPRQHTGMLYEAPELYTTTDYGRKLRQTPEGSRTAIISSTSWESFFTSEYGRAPNHSWWLINTIKQAYRASTPTPVEWGEWHAPLLRDDERDVADFAHIAPAISAGRCVITWGGKFPDNDVSHNLQTFADLRHNNNHTPLKHVATPAANPSLSRYTGWRSLEFHDIPE